MEQIQKRKQRTVEQVHEPEQDIVLPDETNLLSLCDVVLEHIDEVLA